jgi:hypothetical protein
MAKRLWLQPAEVDLLIGDYSNAKHQLAWERRTRRVDLVRLMVYATVEGCVGTRHKNASRMDTPALSCSCWHPPFTLVRLSR